MQSQAVATEIAIRAQADELLAAGLRDTLAAYGDVHVVGSYMLRLMAWRDLDIHLVREPIDKGQFFALGGRIAGLLSPRRILDHEIRDVDEFWEFLERKRQRTTRFHHVP
jgi:hypothetical protein